MTERPTVTGFAPDTTTEIEESADRMNGRHEDALAFVAEHGSIQAPPPVRATLRAVYPHGFALNIQTTRSRSTHRIDFATPIATAGDLQTQFFLLLNDARRAAPDAPLTTIESELQSTASIETRRAHVVATEPVAPNVLQVTLAGLHSVPVLGSDEFFYVIAPSPEGPPTIGPGLTLSELRALPAEQQPHGACYSSRRRRPEQGEVDLWVVRHSDDGMAGWASEAAAGDEVILWGPRRLFQPPPHTDHVLIVADETGLGAAAAIVDDVADDVDVHVVLEVVDEHHRVPLPARRGIRVDWCFRGDELPGTTGLLLDKVKQLSIDPARWFAYGAGESQEMTAVRQLLRHQIGLPARQVQMTPYWRRIRRSVPHEPVRA
ncbi:MAG: SIP domain-containing protein [Actinomycetota bacterium]